MSTYNCYGCSGTGWSSYTDNSCYRITSTSATPPSSPVSALQTGYSGYSISGSFFYKPGSTGVTGDYYTIVTGVDAWDNVGETDSEGPLNRCGIWASLGSSAPPYDTWLGFSSCLSGITETKTYWVGIGADNQFRLKLDGVTVVQSLGIVSNAFQRWNVYPIEIGAGNHTLELFGLNDYGQAGFGCEIYDADLETLTGLTTYSTLEPYIKFTSSGQSLFTVVQDINGTYLSSGYTCPSGYVYSTCSGNCLSYEYCQEPPCSDTLCISNTSYPILDNIYSKGPYHNGRNYWSGTTNGYYIYFKSGTTQWCLSNVLDGPCLLSGKSPCTSDCPDLFGTYLSSGACPTPTPTPTNNCSVLDFVSYFDCSPVEFHTQTPTPTNTYTPTPTPTTTNYCNILKIDADVYTISSTPTVTPTVTPSSSRPVIRDCSFSGDVTFNTVNVSIDCPISKKFHDCFNPNITYTTTDVLVNPSGGEITENMVFNADVDGLPACITYVGITYETIGGNTIKLSSGPLGYSNLGGCTFCHPTRTPTPTPSFTPLPTNTPEPTKTVTPTVTPTKTVTPTVTQTPSITPTNTPTPTVTLTNTPTSTSPSIPSANCTSIITADGGWGMFKIPMTVPANVCYLMVDFDVRTIPDSIGILNTTETQYYAQSGFFGDGNYMPLPTYPPYNATYGPGQFYDIYRYDPSVVGGSLGPFVVDTTAPPQTIQVLPQQFPITNTNPNKVPVSYYPYYPGTETERTIIWNKGVTANDVPITIRVISNTDYGNTKWDITKISCVTCLPPCTYVDGGDVLIGTQTWTCSNLNVTTYRDGTTIPQVTNSTTWSTLTTGAWCYYDNDPSTEAVYGKLYNWYAVNDPRGIAPDGYHVPTDTEWTTLTDYLGGVSIAGGKLKESGTTHWSYPNTKAINNVCFTARPNGMKFGDSYGFINQYLLGYFWTSTLKDANYSFARTLSYQNNTVNRIQQLKKYGFSVRLIKD